MYETEYLRPMQARKWTGCNATAVVTSGSTCTASVWRRGLFTTTTTTCAAHAHTGGRPRHPAPATNSSVSGDRRPVLCISDVEPSKEVFVNYEFILISIYIFVKYYVNINMNFQWSAFERTIFCKNVPTFLDWSRRDGNAECYLYCVTVKNIFGGFGERPCVAATAAYDWSVFKVFGKC